MKNADLKVQPSDRLKSLDALRGFDMFWIMGAEEVFILLGALTGWPVLEWWAGQMTHVEWHGFQAYDMIFPLFLFIAGVSFPFSVSKRLAVKGGKQALYRHIFKRGLILVLLGLIYNNGIIFNIEAMRFPSVLGRIGLAWMFAALIFMKTKNWKSRMVWFWGLLIFYWLLFLIFKAPDFGDPDRYSMQGNISSYIDRTLLPGRLCCYEFGDNEGILPTIAAVSTGLLGMLVGELLKNTYKPMKKVLYMAIGGVILIIIGQIWNLVFPINKNLWSSSFVCYVGGISIILMTIFYLIIDVWKYQKWAFFFVVIGMNPITIYLANRIIGFGRATDFLFGGIAELLPEAWSPLIIAIGYVIVGWLFLYLLYKKKIFLQRAKVFIRNSAITQRTKPSGYSI
jgi:predicted acyltransferase